MTLTCQQARALQSAGQSAELLQQLGRPKADLEPRLAVLRGIALAVCGRHKAARRWLHIQYPAQDALDRSDLGMARLLLGDAEGAFPLLSQAVSETPADPVAQGRLAAACLSRNDLAAAERHYLEALDREPERAEWQSNLAGILARQQRLEEALDRYQQALSRKPDLAQARAGRERLLQLLERSDEVIGELEQALAKDPDNTRTRTHLARALERANRPVDAAALLEKALLPVETLQEQAGEGCPAEKRRAQLQLRHALLELLRSKARYPGALRLVNDMLAIGPERPELCYSAKVSILIEMRRFEQAAEVLVEAESACPDSRLIQRERASLLNETGQYAEALQLLQTLSADFPGDSALQSLQAQTLLWLGRLDEAADLFEALAAQNPMAFAQLVNAKRLPDNPQILKRMQAIADNPLLPEATRAVMGFALAESLQTSKQYERAFYYLALANRLSDRELNYDPDQFSRQIDAICQVFNRTLLDAQPAIRPSDRTPIFVVGMPRSGTTLTEQILCSHPDIFGAGELDLLARLTRLLPRVLKVPRPYPLCIPAMTAHTREEAARFYLHGLYAHDRDHPMVVDKMPHNFLHLGLIQLIFPKAKIVHILRDPRDTALSNFQQNFKARHGGMGYSFDLVKIARQINDYHRLMQHWRKVLTIDLFELRYEDLVADQEGKTRELLDFVGVGWDELVRDFHKTERAVRTASVSQVRQPIYQTSKQKWRRYEAYLGPLLDTLDPTTWADYS